MSVMLSLPTSTTRVEFLADLVKSLHLFRSCQDLVLKHPASDPADPNLGHAEERFVALPGFQVMQDGISERGDFSGSFPVLNAVGPVAVLVLGDPGVNVLGSSYEDLVVSVLDYVDAATGGLGFDFDFNDVVVVVLMACSFVDRIGAGTEPDAMAIVLAG